MERLRSAKFWSVAVGVWWVVLFVASSQASYLPPALFTWQDKVEHAGYFMTGGICFQLLLRARGLSRRLALFTILFCAVNGAFDEWHQTFTPGRRGNDVWDWAADSVGGLLACAVAPWLWRRVIR